MIYEVVKYGDPILDRPTEPVTQFDAELKKLVEDMFESMYEAKGVGLAANQIGIAKRLAVIDISFKDNPAEKLVLVNPKIAPNWPWAWPCTLNPMPTRPYAQHKMRGSLGGAYINTNHGLKVFLMI